MASGYHTGLCRYRMIPSSQKNSIGKHCSKATTTATTKQKKKRRRLNKPIVELKRNHLKIQLV